MKNYSVVVEGFLVVSVEAASKVEAEKRVRTKYKKLIDKNDIVVVHEEI